MHRLVPIAIAQQSAYPWVMAAAQPASVVPLSVRNALQLASSVRHSDVAAAQRSTSAIPAAPVNRMVNQLAVPAPLMPACTSPHPAHVAAGSSTRRQKLPKKCAVAKPKVRQSKEEHLQSVRKGRSRVRALTAKLNAMLELAPNAGFEDQLPMAIDELLRHLPEKLAGDFRRSWQLGDGLEQGTIFI